MGGIVDALVRVGYNKVVNKLEGLNERVQFAYDNNGYTLGDALWNRPKPALGTSPTAGKLKRDERWQYNRQQYNTAMDARKQASTNGLLYTTGADPTALPAQQGTLGYYTSIMLHNNGMDYGKARQVGQIADAVGETMFAYGMAKQTGMAGKRLSAPALSVPITAVKHDKPVAGQRVGLSISDPTNAVPTGKYTIDLTRVTEGKTLVPHETRAALDKTGLLNKSTKSITTYNDLVDAINSSNNPAMAASKLRELGILGVYNNSGLTILDKSIVAEANPTITTQTMKRDMHTRDAVDIRNNKAGILAETILGMEQSDQTYRETSTVYPLSLTNNPTNGVSIAKPITFNGEATDAYPISATVTTRSSVAHQNNILPINSVSESVFHWTDSPVKPTHKHLNKRYDYWDNHTGGIVTSKKYKVSQTGGRGLYGNNNGATSDFGHNLLIMKVDPNTIAPGGTQLSPKAKAWWKQRYPLSELDHPIKQLVKENYDNGTRLLFGDASNTRWNKQRTTDFINVLAIDGFKGYNADYHGNKGEHYQVVLPTSGAILDSRFLVANPATGKIAPEVITSTMRELFGKGYPSPFALTYTSKPVTAHFNTHLPSTSPFRMTRVTKVHYSNNGNLFKRFDLFGYDGQTFKSFEHTTYSPIKQ
jgi:hypothetical protein